MTIFEIAEALRNQRISSLEITQTYINKAYENKHLNAYISINEEIALDQAKQADQHIKKGQFGPLTGVPIAHKDLFCTRGQLTSCASKSLSNFIAPYDATLVEKLNQAGMVTLGKTNMDEFAMGSSNENSIYGSAKNPWNTAHVPGGSSGGSAVVVAADLAPIATGSDTGGSVRQPAAYCGITGIKPSYGRVSRYGMVAFASSLDQAGVLAQDARDAALVLQHMAGFDPKDSTSIDAPVEDYVGALETKIDSLTIGVPKEFFDTSLNSDIAKAIDEAIDVYKRLGAKIVDISLPNVHAGIPCYYVIAPAEASSNLSRFDGVRYGHRSQQVDDLQSLYENSRVEGFGDEVKRRIMMGAYVLSSGYYDAYYMKALKLRRLIANDYQQAFTQCDVILGPTTPTTAFKIGSNQNDPVSMYLNDIYTTSINLTGLPGISIPCGFDENKLPIGLQLIGQYLGEAQLLNQAHQFQQATDWHRKKPQGF